MVGRQGDFSRDNGIEGYNGADADNDMPQWFEGNESNLIPGQQAGRDLPLSPIELVDDNRQSGRGSTRFGQEIYLANADMNERIYRGSGDDYPSFNQVWDSALEQKRLMQLQAMEAQGIGPDGRYLDGYEPVYPHQHQRQRQEIQTHGQRAYPVEAMSPYDTAVFERLSQTVNSLVGHKITEYDHRVSTDLGCARAVSLAMKYGYGYADVDDMNVVNLEKNLRQKGFQDVTISQIKPGDVILGFREEGDYPHAGVYMGNGYIFNNDSPSETMQIQSAEKYNSTEFKRFVILRRPTVVPGVKTG